MRRANQKSRIHKRLRGTISIVICIWEKSEHSIGVFLGVEMRKTEDSKAEPLGFIALSWHASYWKHEIPGRIWDSKSTSLVLRMVGSTAFLIFKFSCEDQLNRKKTDSEQFNSTLSIAASPMLLCFAEYLVLKPLVCL